MLDHTVVFVSFENHYAPWGGLSAVMKRLPPIMSKSIKTILLTPLFQNIEKTKNSQEKEIIIKTEFEDMVLYKGFRHKINIYKSKEFSHLKDFDIFFVKCDKFFLSGKNPYNDTWRFDSLIHDSYFFSKSIPKVLDLIQENYPPPYIIHLQDWETALVVDSFSLSTQHKCFLTLHNPYDEYLPNDPQGRTILQFTIPKMQGLSTVSTQFAHELMNDVLLRDVLCRKLRGEFQLLNPIGIENGNFIEKIFPDNITTKDGILNEKLKNREIFNNLLMESEELNPLWGNKFDISNDKIPLFLIFGRDAPKQKGFDVAAASIYKYLKKYGTSSAFFIFAPIPSGEDLISLSYLGDLCYEYGNNVMVFPYRLSVGYQELQESANYIIMPSYYEPFGAANEGYSAGVPIIARATGGLIQQVCPKNFKFLPKNIQNYVKEYHKDISKPTGFLYRESFDTEKPDNWRLLLSTDFKKRRSITEPIDWRNPVFWSMVYELENVLEEAISYYINNKEEYCDMILNGFDIFNTYSWEECAGKYRNLLYKI
ncbi:MAG: glycogen/starch synthase [Candidatus Lokiarchaeota archaeon]|nr:glycogen/starch synthase [Candidatus Lokiarchaeota archaeon]